jgi:hypothetical protein
MIMEDKVMEEENTIGRCISKADKIKYSEMKETLLGKQLWAHECSTSLTVRSY